MKLALVGFMGCGKSTVGRALGERLDVEFVDLDSRIEAREDRSISEIFSQDGEEVFRRLEYQALKEATAHDGSQILACGGGLFAEERNRKLLVNADFTSIWLNATLKCIRERMSQRDMLRRPLMRDWARVESLYHRRQPLYGLADIEFVIEDGEGVAEIANRIVKILTRRDR